MAAAIMLLFVFESAVSILSFGDKIPASAWWIPIGTYAGYLAAVGFALRSESSRSWLAGDSGGQFERPH
jgi:hypothetical protein